MFTDYLHLHGYAVDSDMGIETEAAILIKARLLDIPKQCTCCGSVLVHNGSYPHQFSDVPRGTKHVTVRVDVPRLYCSNPHCAKTHSVKLPELDVHHRMTVRLIAYIRHQISARMPLVQITRLTGVSTRTVARIYRRWMRAQEESRRVEAPVYMGMDDIRVAGAVRCAIHNIATGKPIELLPDNSTSTIKAYLLTLSNPQNIRAVAIDLSAYYRSLIHALWPDVLIVADKAHVLRRARAQFTAIRLMIGRQFKNNTVSHWHTITGDTTVDAFPDNTLESKAERIRRALNHDHYMFTAVYSTLNDRQRAKIEAWFLQFPALRESHAFLQGLYSLYTQDLRSSAAKEAFADLKSRLSESARVAWLSFFATAERFNDEIWAYFDTHLTNAYPEAINRVMRDLIRMSRNLSYKSLRAKVLYTHSPSTDAERRPLRVVPSLQMPDRLAIKRRRNSTKPASAQSELFPGPHPGGGLEQKDE